MRLLILTTVFAFSSCGFFKSKRTKQKTEKPLKLSKENPEETKSKIKKYRPESTYIKFENEWRLVGDEKDLVYSMVEYIEANAWQRDKSLYHGVRPGKYLDAIGKGPDKFEWIDDTKGKVKGFEKLKPILRRINHRCPGVVNDMLPLDIHWEDSSRHEATISGYYGSDGGGGFFSIKDGIYYDASTALGSSITVMGNYNPPGGPFETYPKQTYKDKHGYLSWDTPVDIDVNLGWMLDETFAHELGHHYFNSWALQNGFTIFNSRHFSENMAEWFKYICYGTYLESPRHKNMMNELHERYSNGDYFQRARAKYYPYYYPYIKSEKSAKKFKIDNPYGTSLLWNFVEGEVFHNRFDPARIWKAVEDTWRSMTGEKVACYPKNQRNGMCNWQYRQDNFSNIEENKPLVWSKKEFVRRFCDNYDCDQKLKKLFNDYAFKYNHVWDEY